MEQEEDPMNTKYRVTVEFSVGGYSSDVKTYTAETLSEIKADIRVDINKFGDEIDAAQERDGDLRAYCPQFANGYPAAVGGAELGSDFDVAIRTIHEDVMTTQEVPYLDDRHADLRDTFN